MDKPYEMKIITLKIKKWQIQRKGIGKLSITEIREVKRLKKLIGIESEENVQIEFDIV